jgi:predicted metalloprotease with PDZ domain
MSPSPVRYRVVPSDPAGHLFTVECTLADPDPSGQVFRLPAWTPGSYLIRDFARHVVSCRAECAGRPVRVGKIDKHSWACDPSPGPLSLIYEVYAGDLSVRGAHLDTGHAYFNGASVFVCPDGRAGGRCELEVSPPAAAFARGWRLATSMRPIDARPWGFGRYAAESYDDLIDHPVECGTFTVGSFAACGVPHEVVVTGRHRTDLPRLTADLQRVCECQIRLFGEPPPFDRYVFLVTALGQGYGGLEHRASASLLCRREDLPKADDSGVGEDYRSFLGLASHEYFHAWNGKRICPAALLPTDLSRERHTSLLWAVEGITSYYDDLSLARAGLIEPEDYLQLVAQQVTRVWRTPGRFVQSLAEASFDAWIKFYRPDENSPNAAVSYYAKGALVALALDLQVRRDSGGERSLDDVMRRLWREYGQSGIGVPEDGVERIAAEVAGRPLEDFFERYVRGTEDPPLCELLARVGVDFRLRAAESQDDKGGRPASRPEWQPRAVLGVKSESAEGGVRLVHVFPEGGARRAGLSAGDLVVALDGIRLSQGNLDRVLGGYAPGSTVRVHAFRRDELIEVALTLTQAPHDTCVLSVIEDVDDHTRARREAWLHGRPT